MTVGKAFFKASTQMLNDLTTRADNLASFIRSRAVIDRRVTIASGGGGGGSRVKTVGAGKTVESQRTERGNVTTSEIIVKLYA